MQDILGPALRDKDDQTKPQIQFGIVQRDANLSLLSYSFNLNPALRHQVLAPRDFC